MSTVFPGTEALLRGRVLSRLQDAGRQGLRPEGVEEDAGLDEIRESLEALQSEGKAFEIDGSWYAEGFGPWAVGVIELLEDGDGVVRSPEAHYRDQPGHYVRKRNLKGALTGDTVLVRSTGRRSKEGDWRIPEASVQRILNERHETLVGTLERDETGELMLLPYDPKMSIDLPVVEADDVPEGHYVVVRIERSERGREPVGRVAEVLGDADEPGVDVLVVLRHYGIPDEFPPAVLEQAERFPKDPTPADWKGREDLRDRIVITIDGESARDFDDAVSIEMLPNGLFGLGVHIADVAHYVEEGTPLDLEAYRRGTSVYYPDRAIPMLPEALSNGLCSLRPNVPRLTTSVFLDMDREGKVHDRRFAETVIRSSRRMTYNEVRRILEEPQERDLAEYGPILTCLRDMHVLMTILHHSRLKRGSIDFDLPEGNVELGTDGTVVGVIPSERNVAHRLIEEFMIAANEAVALELHTREVPALYRVHDAPSPDRLQELRETLRPLGVALKGELTSLHPGALQQVLARVKGQPEEPFVSSLVLRTMQRAVYDPQCRGHYALASHYYCHFTSPIRRYPDLVVHRGLKALVHERAHERAADTALAARLPTMGEHTSSTERRAEQSERDLLQWKKVRFLADRVGQTFKGRITGVQPFGLFVQLESYLVDGLVPIRKMGDDYYLYEAESHRLVGDRTRKVYQLADPLEVELTGVSLRHRGLDLKIVGVPEPGERGEWPRPRESREPGGRGDRKERRERPGERKPEKKERRKRR
ncbi:MAG TPA: ribonuclease R [Thermoanaerobaculia bacterium]|nr:ribonuclease R [Thermoanaerobaculia bacterium]